MLTYIKVKNFKRLGRVAFDLGANVVLIGPNNSGKTTALQALALWNTGLVHWREKRDGQSAKKKRQGVAINRRDLIAIPTPDAKLLWQNLHVRNLERNENGQNTQNVRIEITVSGITGNRAWDCGLEFDYANAESLYCRPLRLEEGNDPKRMEIPEHMGKIRLAFLPPCRASRQWNRNGNRGALTYSLARDKPPRFCAICVTGSMKEALSCRKSGQPGPTKRLPGKNYRRISDGYSEWRFRLPDIRRAVAR